MGALLIFDEIQTARLSTGGRQALLGITPDLTTLGKYHGGGLSFGAFGGRAELMSLYDPRKPAALSHAGTFNNNVLSMAAGHAGLSKVLTAEALDGLNGRGDRLRARLNELLAGIDARFKLTGLGSLMNFHCTAGPACAPRPFRCCSSICWSAATTSHRADSSRSRCPWTMRRSMRSSMRCAR